MAEKKLLSVVVTLEEFTNILLGYEIEVYTDHHLNLTHETTLMESHPVMSWRLLVEEFRPTLRFINGKANIIADTLSRPHRSGNYKSMGSEEVLNLEGRETEHILLKRLKK